MRHSIISWDASFRNFFHTIDSIASQEYDLASVEVIYIEQRSRERSDLFNHQHGLNALSDYKAKYKSSPLNIKIQYLSDGENIPYHLGRCVNAGLDLAAGEIISVMDGDLLLPSDFLQSLDDFHYGVSGIANLVRFMADEPVGVSRENWMDATIDFDACLEKTNYEGGGLPPHVSNKGPMISARREHWDAIDGYDPHPIWSTGLSRLGQDTNARLEIKCGSKANTLPNCFAVHPYHPKGFSRKSLDAVRLLSIQRRLIDWSKAHDCPSWIPRKSIADRKHDKYNELIERIHKERTDMNSGDKWYGTSVIGKSEILGSIYQKFTNLRRRLNEVQTWAEGVFQ